MNEEKYSIKVEWFDEMSSLVRAFTLSYFPSDQTVEMVSYFSKQTDNNRKTLTNIFLTV